MSNFPNQKSSLCPTYAFTLLFHFSKHFISWLLATVVKPLEMGLLLSTTSLVCLLCAISKALMTCTTIPLRSLEGLGYVDATLFYSTLVYSDCTVVLLTSPKQNALQIEGRWTVWQAVQRLHYSPISLIRPLLRPFPLIQLFTILNQPQVQETYHGEIPPRRLPPL